MFELSVENSNGEILNFYSNPFYTVYKIEGLEPPKASLNFSEMANFDGSRYNSGRLENRNIVLYIKIHGNIETNRINLYKYFAGKKLIKIYYKNKSRDVYEEGRVESFEITPFSMNEIAQISIICDNPYWRDAEETTTSFSNTFDLFEFPFSIAEEGIPFSEIGTLTTITINNSEIETGFIITLTAISNQILNPKIVNRTNQTFFALNYDLKVGDVITINTQRNQKEVTLLRGGTKTNIINYIAKGSTWLQLEAGDNELSYECDEGASNLKVVMTAVKCYEGV